MVHGSNSLKQKDTITLLLTSQINTFTKLWKNVIYTRVLILDQAHVWLVRAIVMVTADDEWLCLPVVLTVVLTFPSSASEPPWQETYCMHFLYTTEKNYTQVSWLHKR